MPLYRGIRESATPLRPIRGALRVPAGSTAQEVQLFAGPLQPGNPRMIFIGHGESFDRDGIYGEDGRDYDDNGRRFALLSAAAIGALPIVAPSASVVHAHDWHAAPALALVRDHATTRHNPVLRVLSVHNAAFQGHFDSECIAGLGLCGPAASAADFEWYGRANYLKGGLASADLTFTVSPNHAIELCTPEGGFGMHEQFGSLGNRLVGVLNGVDATAWDPATDPFIASHYSRAALAGKAACKSALQRECGLRDAPRVPVFGMCTRLAQQKGIDLVLQADLAGQSSAQFVFVGRGERRYEEALAELASAAPDRIALRLDFSDALEHRLIAGVDALLMPSLFEPCGLTQMRAQRYGTIPVARKVGGLVDTVVDGVTGFVFDEYTPGAFSAAVGQAASTYAQRRVWRGMVRRAMSRDFGWERAADQYGQHYRAAVAAGRAP
jgi:starch synthase